MPTHRCTNSEQCDETRDENYNRVCKDSSGEDIGYEVNKWPLFDRVVAYLNQSSTQTPPLVLNSVMNSYYAVASGLTTEMPPDKTLKVSNYPLPLSKFAKTDPATNPISFYLSLLCLLGFSCFGGYVAAYPVLERRIKCKHLQMVNGVNRGMYWFSNFVFDYTLYLIPVVLSVIICAAFQLEPMSYPFNIRAFAITLLCFGLSIIPLSYALSFAFKVRASLFSLFLLLLLAFIFN